jgi:NitT/TauT family transport system permease protein
VTFPPRRCALALLLGGAVAVEVVARAGLVDPLTLIPTTEMVRGFGRQLVNPTFLSDHLLPTVAAVAVSFGLAAVVGVSLGILLWRSRFLEAVLDPYLTTYYAIPIFALYPLFLVLFGAGPAPIVAVGVLSSFVIIAVQTAAGLRNTPSVYFKVARSLRLPTRDVVRHVAIPAALPAVFAGLRLGLTYCVIMVVATQFILATRGLGWVIADAYERFDLPTMYGGVIMVATLSLGIISLLRSLERRVSHGSPDER